MLVTHEVVCLYNQFVDEITPDHIAGLIEEVRNGAVLSVAEVQMLNLYDIALHRGGSPTFDEFFAATQAINESLGE